VNLLDCQDLKVRFGGLTARNRLSLSVNEGEILDLIGPNGSVKTIFFYALTSLYPLMRERIEFAGKTFVYPSGCSTLQVPWE